MNPRLARHAARAVPRYTSYPTAPHFEANFPAETYEAWLAALDPAAPASLYLHVPFCAKMCWYCGCNMKLVARYDPVAEYVETLLAEIDLVAARLPGRIRIGHLHWGGGTPTTLTPRDLSRVMDRLAERFDVAPDAELAIESDPRTLTEAMAHAIGRLGFTRASFGVQEFDPGVQAAINRIQPVAMVAEAVDRLRAAGVRGINFDLLYGLPRQTAATLLATIDVCRALAPDRIALFGYAHVPWMAKNQRMIGEDELPDGAARARQSEAAARALQAADYVAIGIDHFALPRDALAVAAREGRLRRNFQGYTTDSSETLIGLGASAIGRTGAGYVQNIGETGAWTREVRAGRLPVARGRALTPEDRLRAEAIERVMCDGRADLTGLAARHGASADWWRDARDELEALVEDGVLTLEGGRLAVTAQGRPLARVVAAAFDAYLPRTAARHSVAV